MYNSKTRKLFLSFLLFLCCCFLLSSTVSALDVFITSDNISGDKTKDVSNLNSVKGYIKNGSLENKTDLHVTVDSKAPKPGEGERAFYSTSKNGVAVYMAASCPGTMKAVSKLAASSSKGVIFVNTGKLNLKTTYVIRRAWDDNFSKMEYAGIKKPYTFLRNAGVWIIQPNIAYPHGTQDQKNRYIARVISNIIANYPSLTSNAGRYYNTKLILNHRIDPPIMAKVARGIYNSTKYKKAIKAVYYSYRPVTFLLMATDYMNGPIYKPIYIKNPKSSHVRSTFSGTISRTDYRIIAKNINRFMRKYKRAPSYVRFKGKKIGYKDVLLMYAILTKGHTSKYKMTLASSYRFRRVYRY